MRKYKQVKRKEVIFNLDEWKEIEEKANKLSMKTGAFIKKMSLDGQITYYNAKNVAPIMNALHNIMRTVDKYHGECNISCENKRFVIDIGFQINNIEDKQSAFS